MQVLLLGARVLGRASDRGEIEQILEFPLGVVLDGEQGTVAQS
jgi:hypothetical protein